MNYKMIIHSMSRILIVIAAVMVMPLALSIVYHEGIAVSYIVPMAICVLIGVLFGIKMPNDRSFYAKEGMVLVGISWIVLSIIGCLPFYISRYIPSFVDCFFETVSGFTTTGSTIIENVEALPKSLLFWRSFTHWLGGLGVLAFTMAIFSSKDSKTTLMMKAEMAGPSIGKLSSKWQYSLRILYIIYIALTVMETAFLLFGGMPLFDSVLHAFGTAGTGGFGIKNASIGYYNSAYIDYVIAIFMMLFGINFNIYYLLIARRFAQVKTNEELKWYIGIVLGSAVVMAVNIMPMYRNSFLTAFRYSFFQVNTIVSTTGYATADFVKWPMLSQILIFLLMFMGACAGSTGGGFKVIRAVLVGKTARFAVRKATSPRSVYSIKMDGKPVSAEMRHGIMAYFAAYMIFCAMAILIVSLDNFDFTTTTTAVVSTLNNIGPGLGPVIGPTGNFAGFSALSKVVLSISMLVGRLEIYPVLVLLSRHLWRKN